MLPQWLERPVAARRYDRFVLPWEMGFVGFVLAPTAELAAQALLPLPDPPQWHGPIPPLPAAVPDEAPQREPATQTWTPPLYEVPACFERAVKRRRTAGSQEEVDLSARALAIKKWVLVTEAAQASSLARQLAKSPPHKVDATMADALATKATNTLAKRAGSLLLFLRWKGSKDGMARLPPTEEEVYAYVCDLREHKPARGPSVGVDAAGLPHGRDIRVESHPRGRVHVFGDEKDKAGNACDRGQARDSP